MLEQEHFLSSVVNTSPAIIYIYDLETQSNVYSNNGIQRILGYSTGHVRAMGAELFANMIHPDDLQRVIAFQSKVLSAADNEILENEHRTRDQDGSWRILHTYERPFLRNADGSLKQKIGVAIDITERKQAEEALQMAYAELDDRVRERTAELERANNRLRIEIEERKRVEEALCREKERAGSILSALDTAQSLIDPDMTIVWVNQKTRDLFPEQEPVGRRCYRFYGGRSEPCEVCAAQRVFATGEVAKVEKYNPERGRWYTHYCPAD